MMIPGNFLAKSAIFFIAGAISLGFFFMGVNLNPIGIYELRILQAIYYVGAAVVFLLGILPWTVGWEEEAKE